MLSNTTGILRTIVSSKLNPTEVSPILLILKNFLMHNIN